ILLAAELEGHMNAGWALYAPQATPWEAELAYRAAVNARQTTLALNFLAEREEPGEWLNLRDAAMRENIEWILHREERLIVAAHNAHLQRSPLVGGDIRMRMLGEYLAAIDGLSNVVIDTTYASGEVIKFEETSDGDRTKTRMYLGE